VNLYRYRLYVPTVGRPVRLIKYAGYPGVGVLMRRRRMLGQEVDAAQVAESVGGLYVDRRYACV